MERLDAVVVGSGPNGLAAAVVLAAAGLEVRVYEAAAQPGGGCRTAELTLSGFRHDVCSAAHPLAIASPFFRRFDLAARGVHLLQPEVAYAHPLDGGRAGVVHRSLTATAAGLGDDGAVYERLFGPFVAASGEIVESVVSSMRTLPRRPLAVSRFALESLRPTTSLARRFSGDEARALLAGVAVHAMRPLERPLTSGVALLLGMLAHSVGWPVVEGGSGRIVEAMLGAIGGAGGEVVSGQPVRSLAELPPARAVLLDVTPRGLLDLAGDRLPAGYRRRLSRFRYGPGVCKVDYALAGPVPWTAEPCRRAGTVHLGGRLEEIARSEREVALGRHPERPYVLVVQPGVVDATRAPAGGQTLWAYCHVPSGSGRDVSESITCQIERFAPGFRDLVLASSVLTAEQEQAHNANYVGGDIGGGVQDLRQTIARPVAQWNPYRTPLTGVYLCSSSTPPGGGVHGRCGELAARTALREVFGIRAHPDLSPSASQPADRGSPR
ncbi:MAG TPA: NAD(P)/FAD-dependent oxidoreductase [Acidimicrobiales bacterium]|nr:NAD(P)/FAD-dependent oxidoreductase [Acidimicrobiales bacterium]